MKRTFATLGVMGLGLMAVTAPAMAAPNMVIVCHDGSSTGTGWDAVQFNVNGLNGHDEHDTDIIPPNDSIPLGLNWTNAGKITYIANCAPLPPGETPPVYPPVVVLPVEPVVVVPPVEQTVVPPVEQTVVPPVEQTVVPPVEQTVVPPVEQTVVPPVVVQAPVTTVTPTVQTPAAPTAVTGKTPAATGAAAVSQGTNQGFNAQTAVGGTQTSPTWLAGLGLMLGAGAVVAIRRRSLEAQAD